MLPVLPQCLSSELPLPCVLLAAELLSVLVDHDGLAQQLCSHSGKGGGREGGMGQDRFRASQGLLHLDLRYSDKETLSKAEHPFQKAAFS